ncbi:fumarylacetoacetate hydrolase family protein [Kocuria rhizophila]|uniref:fumarylacetoacetate hydrolase family protein n=1 Tax=Kocuria rhizophila TaxID=72000 RepID=UPI00057E43D5|nr:fumarylacetoacetate hydrolase family protein [Kocuria rhizophila]KIC70127.1 fumarylacetoacetate hydrolase [Kocuria rhizophila]
MKIANVSGRAALITADGRAVDIERASYGAYGPDLPSVYERWAEFLDWSGNADWSSAPAQEFTEHSLGSPSPQPRQILAIGLNYSAHAAESGFEQPDTLPPVFTKFVSALTGPYTTVELPEGGHTDWEVELTVVIGKEAHRVAAADAWDHVAGVTVAQDLSERITQLDGPAPQFGFGKSFPGFLPVGPYLVTADELPDRDAVDLSCDIDGEVVQSGNTRDLIFPVAQLIEGLSRVVTLYPGDLIITGTPDGIGAGRTPQRFLQDGEVLTSRIAGIGELRQTFVAAKN